MNLSMIFCFVWFATAVFAKQDTAASSSCSLVGSFHRAEKQEFAGGSMGVHGDLNLHFFDAEQFRLNFDVVLRAFGEDERCIVAARGSWRLERDGRVRIAIEHCEARDASGDLRVPSKSTLNPLAMQVEKSCSCPEKLNHVARHTFSNKCRTLRMPLPEFEGIEPLFQRKSDVPTISMEQFDQKWLKADTASSSRPKPKQVQKEKPKLKPKAASRKQKTSLRTEL